MKFLLLTNLYLLFSLQLIQNVNNTKGDIINFTLNMKDRNISNYSQFEINLKFKAVRKEGVIIPKIFFFGYEDDPDTDVIFELYRYEKTFFKKITPNGNYDLLYKKEYASLSYLQTTNMDFDLFHFYSTSLNNGKYRVRAKFIVPLSNKYSKSFIYSNWIYFTVNDLKLPSAPEQKE